MKEQVWSTQKGSPQTKTSGHITWDPSQFVTGGRGFLRNAPALCLATELEGQPMRPPTQRDVPCKVKSRRHVHHEDKGRRDFSSYPDPGSAAPTRWCREPGRTPRPVGPRGFPGQLWAPGRSRLEAWNPAAPCHLPSFHPLNLCLCPLHLPLPPLLLPPPLRPLPLPHPLDRERQKWHQERSHKAEGSYISISEHRDSPLLPPLQRQSCAFPFSYKDSRTSEATGSVQAI